MVPFRDAVSYNNRGAKANLGQLVAAIANYVRKKYSLLIGEQTAEEVKINLGSALPMEYDSSMEVKGLPRTTSLASSEVTKAMEDPLSSIIATIRSTLKQTPPELASDIIDRGIVLTGGGALGAGRALENYQIMRRSLPEIL